MMGKIHAADDIVEAVRAPRIHLAAEVTEAPTEKTTQGAAALLHGAQGASFGTSDELTGVASAIVDNPWVRKLREKLGIFAPAEVPVATTREGKVIKPPEDIAPKSFGDAYRGGRDSAREDLDQTRQDWGKTAVGSELLTSVLNPIKAPIRGGGIWRTGARAGLEGAAYAAGASEADLTKGEGAKFLRDTAGGGLAGAAVGTAAGAGGKLLRKGAEAVVENLEQRVLNELAEAGPRSVTQKVRAKLERAGRDILAEVVEGPDAETVRKAMQAPKAAAGRTMLRPVLDSANTALDDGYQAFRDAGRNLVDSEAYYVKLTDRAADPALSSAEAAAINKLAANFDDLVSRNKGKPLDLQRVRKFTTETQEAASQVTSDPTIQGRLKLKLSAIATDAMDDLLTTASKGNKKLEQAANQIRETNKRMHALLTVDNALASRVGGESSARGGLVRLAEKAAMPAAVLGAVGGLGLIANDPAKAVERAGIGLGLALAGRGLPRAARALERGVTTRAINLVRNVPAPGATTLRGRLAEKLARAKAEAASLERYGKIAGGVAGRRAVFDDEEAP